jgi:hypothetical protein
MAEKIGKMKCKTTARNIVLIHFSLHMFWKHNRASGHHECSTIKTWDIKSINIAQIYRTCTYTIQNKIVLKEHHSKGFPHGGIVFAICLKCMFRSFKYVLREHVHKNQTRGGHYEKSILLKFCPDIPYYIGKCRFNTTTLNRHFVWENMRRF